VSVANNWAEEDTCCESCANLRLLASFHEVAASESVVMEEADCEGGSGGNREA
jgi:hypothetical protein